jgi:CheY-like chemotaxis protein
MNAEVMSRVFEPFYTTKPAGRGTGLGLATAHGIIRSAGGAIEIDSELGRGTIFRIYFPAYDAEDAEDPRKSTRDIPKGAGQLVLLCEDEETVRAMTEHMLRRAAYQVISVAGPRQALEVLDASQVDLLITDVIMPEMDGSQLATQALLRHPQLPVLFVSGYTAGVLAAQQLEENGPNFLRKPYRARELLERVHTLLHRHPQSQSTS